MSDKASRLKSSMKLWSAVRRMHPIGSKDWKEADAYYRDAIRDLTSLAGDEAVEAVQAEICRALREADEHPRCCYSGRNAPGKRLSVFRSWSCPEPPKHVVSWTRTDGEQRFVYYCAAHAPQSVPTNFDMRLEALSE